MYNSILLTPEALLSLLKETKIIGKNLDNIRAREIKRADQGEVIVDVSGDRYRHFAADQRADRGRSLLTQREVVVGGSTAKGGRRRRERSPHEDQCFVNFFVVIELRKP